jgi:hypothetical protein
MAAALNAAWSHISLLSLSWAACRAWETLFPKSHFFSISPPQLFKVYPLHLRPPLSGWSEAVPAVVGLEGSTKPGRLKNQSHQLAEVPPAQCGVNWPSFLFSSGWEHWCQMWRRYVARKTSSGHEYKCTITQHPPSPLQNQKMVASFSEESGMNMTWSLTRRKRWRRVIAVLKNMTSVIPF